VLKKDFNNVKIEKFIYNIYIFKIILDLDY